MYNGTHSLINVTASGSGAPESYGVFSGYKFNAPTVTVNQSRVSGATNSVYAFGGGAAGGAAKIGASQLTGPTASPRSFSGHLRSLVQRRLRAAVADLRLIATT